MTTMKNINATRPMEIVLAKRIETANAQTTRSFAPGRGLLAVLATMTRLAALFLVAMMPRWQSGARSARDQRPTISVVSPEYEHERRSYCPASPRRFRGCNLHHDGCVRHRLVNRREDQSRPIARRHGNARDRSGAKAGRASREQAAANLNQRSHADALARFAQKDVVSSRSSMRKEPDSRRARSTSTPRRKCKATRGNAGAPKDRRAIFGHRDRARHRQRRTRLDRQREPERRALSNRPNRSTAHLSKRSGTLRQLDGEWTECGCFLP